MSYLASSAPAPAALACPCALGAAPATEAALNSWWTIGALALVAGGAVVWWHRGEERARAAAPRRRGSPS